VRDCVGLLGEKPLQDLEAASPRMRSRETRHSRFRPQARYQRWAIEEGQRGAEVRNRIKLLGDLEAALRGVKVSQRRLPESTEKAYRPRGLSGVSQVREHWLADS